jgi:hypothetical protein
MDSCKWVLVSETDYEYWDTDCGESFQFNDGTPSNNHFNFCPYCGKPIEQVEPKEELDD